MFRADEVNDLANLPRELARTANGGSLVIVPLIFDLTDSLYSAEGYNHSLAAADEGAEPVDGEVYFTDYDTFVQVIGGTSRRIGGSYEQLYADGSAHRAPSGEAEAGTARLSGSPDVVIFDPYQCGDAIPCPDAPNVAPPPCDLTQETYCGGGGGGGGGGSTNPNSIRPQTDQSVIRSSSPNWPTLWVGDVISGEKDCGSTSGGSSSGCSSSSGGGSSGSNFGHSLIVTQLDSGEQWGGDFESIFTRSMEAIGDRPDPAEEVVEREAYTWFDSPQLEYAKVLYHRAASWSQRYTAVAYARAQNPDPYAVFTTKNNEDEWYCSKLVWKAYKEATGNSLDPNWGPYVFPSDLEHSGHLVTVYHYEHQ